MWEGGRWLAGEAPPAREVATRSRPARREIRSARSASRVVVEEVEADELWWPWPWEWGKGAPVWPSLMAVVESAEREVVPELGVPLDRWLAEL